MVILYILLILAVTQKAAAPMAVQAATELLNSSEPTKMENGISIAKHEYADKAKHFAPTLDQCAIKSVDEFYSSLAGGSKWNLDHSRYTVAVFNKLNPAVNGHDLFTLDENGVMFCEGSLFLMSDVDHDHLHEQYAEYAGNFFHNNASYEIALHGDETDHMHIRILAAAKDSHKTMKQITLSENLKVVQQQVVDNEEGFNSLIALLKENESQKAKMQKKNAELSSTVVAQNGDLYRKKVQITDLSSKMDQTKAAIRSLEAKVANSSWQNASEVRSLENQLQTADATARRQAAQLNAARKTNLEYAASLEGMQEQDAIRQLAELRKQLAEEQNNMKQLTAQRETLDAAANVANTTLVDQIDFAALNAAVTTVPTSSVFGTVMPQAVKATKTGAEILGIGTQEKSMPTVVKETQTWAQMNQKAMPKVAKSTKSFAEINTIGN